MYRARPVFGRECTDKQAHEARTDADDEDRAIALGLRRWKEE